MGLGGVFGVLDPFQIGLESVLPNFARLCFPRARARVYQSCADTLLARDALYTTMPRGIEREAESIGEGRASLWGGVSLEEAPYSMYWPSIPSTLCARNGTYNILHHSTYW